MEPTQGNTHIHSPGWAPLKSLFRLHAAEFVRLHGEQRFSEKYMIGVAMWAWMCETGRVEPGLRTLAEEVHFRPKKQKSGLPLWRLAFKDTLRNTPEIDALFDGKRIGPTPRYARLVDDGLVPADPRQYEPEHPGLEVQPSLPLQRRTGYSARKEWSVGQGGEEWLYVYTTMRELENYEKREIVPLLKIGQTKQHYSIRVASQLGSTSAHSVVVCLLAYQARNAQQLEAAVHKALKVQDRHVKDAPGIEWFEVTPEAAHQLIVAIAGDVRPIE